jgi:hypothetical protein
MNKHTITTRIVYKKGFMLCTNGAECHFLLKQQKLQGLYIRKDLCFAPMALNVL